MHTARWLRRAGWLAGLGFVLLSTGALRADEEAPAEEKTPASKEEAVRTERTRRAIRVERAGSKYWLGLQLEHVPDAVNDQLDLKGEGTLVADVTADGPAAKAGIKKYDIVLSVDDKSVKSAKDVLQMINESDGKEMAVKIVRAGKPQTISLTPIKHSAVKGTEAGNWRGNVDLLEIEKNVREKLKRAGVDMRMEFVQPGKVFPPGVQWEFEVEKGLPDDLTVDIHRQGKTPAEITVKKGDQTWTAKEGDLGSLPEDVRGHVEGLLSHGRPFRVVPNSQYILTLPPMGPAAVVPPQPPQPPRYGRGKTDDEQRGDRVRGSLEKRLEEMDRRLGEMRKQLEPLRDAIRDREKDEAREKDSDK